MTYLIGLFGTVLRTASMTAIDRASLSGASTITRWSANSTATLLAFPGTIHTPSDTLSGASAADAAAGCLMLAGTSSTTAGFGVTSVIVRSSTGYPADRC